MKINNLVVRFNFFFSLVMEGLSNFVANQTGKNVENEIFGLTMYCFKSD